MAMASTSLHQSLSPKYPHLFHNSRLPPTRLRFTSLRFPSTIRATSAVSLEPELSTQQSQTLEADPFACPICYQPLIRKGPPGFNLPAIYRSGFKCNRCNKTYSSKENYLDLTITAGMKDYTEVKPARTELFRNPLVSFLYERGWRQNFNQSGFPGPDEEFKMAQEYFKPAVRELIHTILGAVFRNLALVRADVSITSFASGSVDAIHAGAALHCWPSASNAVAEICRALRSGGVFVGTTFLQYSSTTSWIERPFREGTRKPAWLEALYTQKFFAGCSYHETAKKNEKNVCCLDCCVSICPHCIPSHRFHSLLQVRRYVYHDVVRLEDLEKLIDCSNVQAYTINSAKVVFIKKRPQNRQFKGAGNYCTSCDRSLQEPFLHCSLGCKVDYVLKHYRDLSPYLRRCNALTLGPDFFIPQDLADDEMTNETWTPHSTVVDSDEPLISWSSSSSGSENMSMATSEIVRKKRSGLYVCARSMNRVSDEDIASSMSRRKGIPHRSPLC
uniref:Methyltransferase type 11 domain-containing protein n=1 Tax=Salix viminalis TaxID=40686 RepID=A0A6N2K0J0_SALVM